MKLEEESNSNNKKIKQKNFEENQENPINQEEETRNFEAEPENDAENYNDLAYTNNDNNNNQYNNEYRNQSYRERKPKKSNYSNKGFRNSYNDPWSSVMNKDKPVNNFDDYEEVNDNYNYKNNNSNNRTKRESVKEIKTKDKVVISLVNFY